MSLSSSQKRYLRGLAHAIKPVIHVGQKGLSDSLLAELDAALAHHELVKVKVFAEERDARDDIGEDLAKRTSAQIVQRVGHVVCLYRRNADKPRIALPE